MSVGTLLNKPGKVIGMGTIIGSAISNICVIMTSILAAALRGLSPTRARFYWYLSITILLIVAGHGSRSHRVIILSWATWATLYVYFSQRSMDYMEKTFGARHGSRGCNAAGTRTCALR